MFDALIIATCAESDEPGICSVELNDYVIELQQDVPGFIIEKMLQGLAASTDDMNAEAVHVGGHCGSDGCTTVGIRKDPPDGGGGFGGGGGGEPSGPSGPGFNPGGGGSPDWVDYAGPTDIYCSTKDSDVSNGNVGVSDNGVINIDPRSRTVPDISIPNTVGAEGFSAKDLFDHIYNYYTEIPDSFHDMGLTPDVLGRAIALNPAPNNPQPASPSGTRNNVGTVPGADDTNYVRSFLVSSPDPSRYTDIVVNYTIDGEHALEEGMVIRYGMVGPDGRVEGIRTYGEGNGWRQNAAVRGSWCTYGQNLWEGVDLDTINIGLNLP